MKMFPLEVGKKPKRSGTCLVLSTRHFYRSCLPSHTELDEDNGHISLKLEQGAKPAVCQGMECVLTRRGGGRRTRDNDASNLLHGRYWIF